MNFAEQYSVNSIHPCADHSAHAKPPAGHGRDFHFISCMHEGIRTDEHSHAVFPWIFDSSIFLVFALFGFLGCSAARKPPYNRQKSPCFQSDDEADEIDPGRVG